MASIIFDSGMQYLLQAGTADLDWEDNALIYIALYSDTALGGTITASTGTTYAVIDALGTQLSGEGYVDTGKALETVTVDLPTEGAAATTLRLNAADVTWTGINAGTIKWALIYWKSDPKPAICAIDLADTVTNGGDITIQWGAEGIIKFDYSLS